ncbi:non-ribosomal peptide synthase/polyketide synthase [Sorangium sp. So ce1128]
MTMIQLFEELAQANIKLSCEGEQLSIRAPKGALTSALRARIAENKGAILAALRQRAVQGSGLAPAALSPAPQDRHRPFPLTEIQQAYWVGRLNAMDMGGIGCHAYCEVDAAALDLPRLAAAWRRLIERHDMLRAVFLPDGQQQILEEAPAYEIQVVDLRGRPPEAIDAELERLRGTISHRVYDPARWPLFDIRAARVEARRFRLFFSFDLLILDAASLLQIMDEWRQLYEDPAAAMEPLSLSFRDYVLAEAALRGSDDHKRSDAYWLERVATLPMGPDLPVNPAPSGHEVRFVRRAGVLDAEGFRRLKARAARAGLTPSGALCAAYAEVLAAWSRSERFSITLTLFRRLPLHPQIQQIVGDFTSTLLLEFSAPQGTFEERARALQAQLKQDLDHTYVSGVRVIRELNRARGQMASHGVPVVFTSTLGHRGSSQTPPLSWAGELVYAISQTPQVWLDLQVTDHHGGVLFTLDAFEAIFPEGMLDDMARAYDGLLQRLAWDESSWHADARELVPVPAPQLALRARVNATDAPVSDALLHTLFAARAEEHPERPAIVSSSRTLTYGELLRRSTQVGRALRALGARPGALVAVVMEKGWEQAVAVLGILMSGAAYLPIDPAVPPERLGYLLSHGQVERALTQSWLDGTLAWPEGTERLCVDREETWAAVDPSPLAPAQGPLDLAYVIYTSGSTGVPKGVMIDHRGAVNTLLEINRRFGVGPSDRVLALSSLSFDLSVYDVFGLLAAGGAIVFPEDARRRDPAHWTELVEAHGVSIWNTVPALMAMWVDHLERGAAPAPRLPRLVLMSGDWIPVALPDRIRALSAARAGAGSSGEQPWIISLGGATEASIWSIFYPIEQVDPAWKSIPYGRPMANQRFHVLDDGLYDCPAWVPGQLYIGGVGLAKGYWRDEERTRQSFIVHPRTGERLYRTGDFGRYLGSGDLEFLGRRDGQVKIGGHRIELGEIEAALAQHPDVRSAVALAKGEPRESRSLVAFVVPKAPRGATSDDLREFLLGKLPEYMVPPLIVQLDALPVTSNGKIDRRALLDLAHAPAQADRARMAPRNELEARIASVIEDALKVQGLGVSQNLFELGSTSLHMVWIANRLREQLGCDLRLAELFRYPTVEGLASRVSQAEARRAEGVAEARALAPAAGVISPSQQRLWFFDRLSPGTSLYHVHVGIRMKGRLVVSALRRSLEEIVRRHEALRMIFPEDQGEARLAITPPGALELPIVERRGLEGEAREQEIRRRSEEHAAAPFDLARGPLCRLELLILADDDAALFVTQHHIITDGWSIGVFGRDLAGLYGAFVEDRPSPLPPLPLGYGEIARQQRAWAAGEAAARDRAYWRDNLAGLPPLALPLPHAAPALPTHRGATRFFSLSEELSGRLQALALREGCSLFMVLFAAFAVVLHRITGQVDFGVGAVAANRGGSELKDVIGFFANILVLRCDLSGDPTFRDLLARVRDTSLEAFEHQALPFDEVVNAVGAPRGSSLNPLVQACFALENVPIPSIDVPGMEWTPMLHTPDAGVEGTAKFDLSLIMAPTGGRLSGTVEFCTDLLDAGWVERLLGHLRAVLEGAVEAPATRVSELSLLTEAERLRLLAAWNQTDAAYPKDACVHELFEAQVARTPDAVAATYGERQWTYRELDRRANGLAHRLRSLGVGPDVLVALCVERSLEMIAGLLAILKAGGAYVPLDPTYPKARLAFLLEDARARVLLTDQAWLLGQGAGVPTLPLEVDERDLSELPGEAPVSGAVATDLAYVIYTSGSTGVPKGVAVTHRGIARLVMNTDYVRLGPSDAVAQASNSSFDAATFEIWGALLNGARLVGVEQGALLSPPELSRRLAAQGVTVLFLTAALFHQMARDTPAAFAGLSTLLVGGEALDPRRTRAVLQAGPPRRLVNGYGPTETTTFATWHLVTEVPEGATAVPIGTPIANTRAYVLDRHLEPVPIGVLGELYIGGPGVARGYLNRPELTAERFIPDPYSGEPGARLFRTGDLCRRLPDGTLDFTGRIDHQVKLRGFRIELGEIELTLGQHPDVRQAVVVAREDASGNGQLVAYVVARGGAMPDPAELRRHLQQKLPDYMIPAVFVALPAIPLSPNGKVDRKALPAPDLSSSWQARALVAPRTPIEELLAGIWAELLGIGRVGMGDDFFAVGGHSLLATQVLSRVRRALAVDLPVRALFEARTIALLAERIEAAKRAGAPVPPPLAPAPREGELPLSFAQQRLWFLDQLEPGSAFYNIPAALRLTGPLDAGALERSFLEIARRHEALRTTFEVSLGEPRQVIAAEPAVTLATVDLSALAGEAQEAEVARRAAAEAEQPFSLTDGPLLRVTLLRLSRSEHVLLATMHHIVSDGWSLGVLLRELSALYGAFCAGRPSALPALPVQYADYAVWQRRWLSGDTLDRELAYWKQQLSGAPAALDLPTDRPRPPVQTYRGATCPVALSPELSSAVARLGRREGVTLFMTLLAAFQVLLHRYTGQHDVVVGSPIAGRTAAETEGLIGFFVNTLVLRTDLSGEPSFVDLLRRVRDVTLGAYAHQHVPFERLVEALSPERDLSRSPLFQVMFALQNAPLPDLALGDVALRPLQIAGTTSKFDLILSLGEGEAGISGTLEYNTDLFDPGTIQRMVKHLTALLDGIVQAPERRVSELPLLTGEERQQLLFAWNDTAASYPAEACFHELFEAQVERTPDAAAAIFEEERLTYRQLNRRANRMARQLRRSGVGRDVVVALLMDRGVDLLTAILAVFKAGGAYMPLDPRHPPERLRQVLRQSAARAVVVTRASSRALDGVPPEERPEVLEIEALAACPEPEDNLGVRVEPLCLAYVIYTSGSTGVPKGAMVAQRGMINHLYAKLAELSLTEADCIAQNASQCFDISVWQLLAALLVGGRVHIVGDGVAGDAERLFELVASSGVSILEVVPSLLSAALEDIAHRGIWPDLPALRWLILTGEALPPDLCRRWLARYPGIPIVNAYGPTECSDDVAHHRVASPPGSSVVYTPIGRPIINTQLYVLDARMQPVPVGVPGELYVGGDGVGRGYLRDPARTSEVFLPDPFSSAPGARLYRTGDLTRLLPGGELEFLGRIGHQVKLRGFRIELGEIESVLGKHPAVREAVVVVRGDTPSDKRLCAYVVARGAVSEADLRRHVGERLPEYMVPAAIVTLEAMPLSPNGKVDRKALPAPDRARIEQDRAFVAPRTAAEELLAEIWSEVLGVDRVGADDSFFAVGGHSLLATQVLSRVRRAFAVDLPLRALFEAPTLAGLAGRIEAAKRAGAPVPPPLAPAPREGELPLSFAQQRLWFLDQLEPGSAFYNVPLALRLTGPLDAGALERSFLEIARRHEALRTTFLTDRGRARQVIAAEPAVTLATVDLSALAGEAQEAEVARRAAAEAEQPFSLTDGPLLRVTLLRLSRSEHVLLATMHHIVSDGWSLGVLLRELSALYGAFCAGRPSALPALPVQYADYAVWQRRWLSGDTLDRELAYWKQQLSGAPAALDLPTDRPRPPVQTYRGATCPVALSPELSSAVARLGRREGVTLFMTLLAAFQVLLHRYTGQHDVVVGSPIAGRTAAETEGLIGFFVNTLVLRTDLSGEPSFVDLLRRVRDVTLGAYAHQHVPFERLVEALSPERDLSRSPLFQVMFALQNAPLPDLALGDVALRPLQIAGTTSKFELTLVLGEDDGRLAGAIEYNTDLFDAATIERLSAHLVTLLESAVSDPSRRVGDLDLLPPDERRTLAAWSRARGEAPCDACIHALFEAQAERTPDAVALVFEGERLTYRELNARADRLARRLSRLGAGPGVLVGLCAERSMELVIGILGILKSGAAYVPLDPGYPRERLAFIVRDARSPVLVTQRRLLPDLPAHAARVVLLDEGAEEEEADGVGEAARPCEARPEDVAYVIYTSGSTGTPKGVMVAHRNVTRLFAATEAWFSFGERDVWTLFHSFAFDFSVWELWGALFYGGRLVVVPFETSRSPGDFYRLLCREGVTVLNQTPSAFRQLVGVERSVADAGERPPLSLRSIIFGGEAVDLRSLEPWFERHGELVPELVNMYGITETTVHVTYRPLRAADLRAPSTSPMGRQIPDLSIHVLDRRRQPAPIGVPGELYVGGAGVALGYLNRPELTAEKFLRDPFAEDPQARLYRTGDLARWLPSGELEYLGRIDDQVKIRGFRIELGEIESALGRHPLVAASTLMVREDAPGDRRLVAYVVPRQGGAPSSSALREHLLATLPEYMVPSAFVLLDALPLTANGKVDRRALPAPGHDRPDLARAYVAPRTPEEATLAAIWGEVLEVDRVGIDDGFFELGGDSIRSIQVLSRARERGIALSLQELFQLRTIRALGDVRRSLEPAPEPARSDLLRADDRARLPEGVVDAYPLAALQTGMVFHSELRPSSAVYNDIFSTHLEMDLDVEALRTAIGRAIARHPVLRTSFDLTSFSEPLQLVHRAVPIPLQVDDLTALSEAEQERTLAAWMEAESRCAFDWSRPPLLRFYVHLRGERTLELSLRCHHAILDGWSVASLMTELFQEYDAAARGEARRAAPPESLYRDFVALEREALASAEAARYWDEQLEGAAPAALPRQLGAGQAGAGDERHERSLVVAGEVVRGLKAAARAAGAPLKSALLVAHLRVLALLSGQVDLVTGLVVNGRPEAREADRALGLYLNTVPFRQRLHGGSWIEAIQEALAVEQSLLPHRRYPMAHLLRRRGGPLFEAVFNFTHFHVYRGIEAARDEIRVLRTRELAWTNFAFVAAFDLDASEAELRLQLYVDLPGISARQVDEIAGYYERALAQIAEDPSAPVHARRLLPPAEADRILTAWGRGPLARSTDACVHELFEAQVDRAPDAVAVASGAERWSYGELDRQANRLAHHLRRRGVGPDTLVGLCVERSFEALVGALGVLKAGGAYVAMDPAHPSERLAFMAADAGVRVLLTASRLLPRLPELQAEVIPLDAPPPELLAQSEERLRGIAGPGHLAYVIYTSGSTGRPKGVLIEHRSLANLAAWHVATYGVTPADRATLVAAPGFDASVWEVWPHLVAGASLWIPDDEVRASPSALWAWVAANGITLTFLPTPLAEAMLAEPAGSTGALRAMLTGGDRLQQRPPPGLGFSLFNHYGPTEATVVTTAAEVAPEGAGAPAIGGPIANAAVYVLGPHLEPVPAGVPGELYIGGAGVARGYLNRPDLTEQVFVADPFSPEPGAPRMYRTGDIVRWLPTGELEFLGRRDEQVKIRGFRVELGEIEAALRAHPSVREAIALVREDAPGDRRLVGYVVPQAEREEPEAWASELRRHLKERLPEPMVPSALVPLAALPLTPNSKLDRRALPAPEARHAAAEGDRIAPRNRVEAELAALWEELLGTRPVGVRDDFFALGGHSLLAVRLMASVERRFGERVPVASLYRSPTVESLAALLQSGSSPAASSALVPLQPAGDKPAFFCVHPAGGTVFCYRELSGRLGVDRPFYGLQALGTDDEREPLGSVEAMARRYLDAVRAAQPEGPYHLGGWSFGGLVAFELASQLAAEGHEVATLALIDAPAPGALPDSELDELALVAFIARAAGLAVEQEELRELTLDQAVARVTERAEASHRALPGISDISRLIHRGVRLTRINAAAARRYVPRHYPGPLALLNARDNEGAAGALRSRDPACGWGGFAAAPEVILVPGTHETIMTEPHVGQLASALRRVLDAGAERGDGEQA